MEKDIDCKGMACPLPVVNAKKAAEALGAGDVLTVLVDNEIAVQNLKRFAEHKGFGVSAKKKGDNEYTVIMNISGIVTEKANDEEAACIVDSRRKGMLVVLSGNVMGTGDAKLGTSLMKAFVFALTKQDQLPDTILCYNTGAYLTCGTCLDFYGLKENLAVGGVTNMYDIVERMENAAQIIKP